MNHLTSIVVGVDFSACSRTALHQAARVAQWSNAHLHIAHVGEYLVITDMAEALGHTIARVQADTIRQATGKLEAWLAEIGPPGPHSVEVVVAAPIERLLRKDWAGATAGGHAALPGGGDARCALPGHSCRRPGPYVAGGVAEGQEPVARTNRPAPRLASKRGRSPAAHSTPNPVVPTTSRGRNRHGEPPVPRMIAL